jgi:hypothetical protein
MRKAAQPSPEEESGWLVLSPMLAIGFLLFLVSNALLVWWLTHPANGSVPAGVWFIAGYQATALLFFSVILFAGKSLRNHRRDPVHRSDSFSTGGLS